MTATEQRNILKLMEKYNTMSRRVIKENLFCIRDREKLTRDDIAIDLKLEKEKIRGWFNRANSCIPTFYDALRLADMYKFDIEELVNEEFFGYHRINMYPIELKRCMA